MEVILVLEMGGFTLYKVASTLLMGSGNWNNKYAAIMCKLIYYYYAYNTSIPKLNKKPPKPF